VCLIQRKSEDTTLVLELTSGGSCVTLPIISFPLCPSYWDVQPPVTIHNLRLAKFPFDDLLLDWPGCKVTNKLRKQSLTVTTSLNVGLLNSLKVKRIINQPYCAYILIVHQGFAIPLHEIEITIWYKRGTHLVSNTSVLRH
jgi:hypothetical protein